jgi:diguanylate cyclase (GGDEF)-like protein
MSENSQLVAFYFASTIGINIICALLLFFSRVKQQEAISRALFFGCISTLVYQYVTWMYHSSTDLESSISLLKIQTGIFIFCMPFYAQIVFLWANQPIKKSYFFLFSLICLIFFILNIIAPNGLRYVDNIELVEYTVFASESVSRLSGRTNPIMLGLHLFTGAVVLALVAVVFKSLVRKQLKVAATLIGVLILQGCVTFNAIKIDSGVLSSIYLGGVPFTVLNFIACMSIAGALRAKSKLLTTQINMRKKLESVLAVLARGVSRSEDNSFYINMMLELQKLTGATLCCIVVPQSENKICYLRTEALVFKGRALKTVRLLFSEELHSLIAETEALWLPDKVQESYPQLNLFKRLKVHSYISVPMLNGDSELEGNLILMFAHAYPKDDNISQVLDVFASRAGAELQRAKVARQLHRMAYFDYQTRLPNASNINDLIEQRYLLNEQSNSQSALIMFELNQFTEINRQFGFKYSEIAIQTLGERFSEYSQDDIIIARTGADEFICLLYDLTPNAHGIMKLHWEAIAALIKKPIPAGELLIRINCRGGGVVFPEQTNSSKEVLRCAEIALADAKQTHTSSLVLFNQSSLAAIDRKELLLKLLEPALNSSEEIYAVFQPKVNYQGEIQGCEALIRWKNDSLGMISPEEFVTLAEESSLVDRLGIWMLREVCKQILRWREQGLSIDFRVAVNVSPYQLAQDDFVGRFTEILLYYEVAPSSLEIEITESSLMANMSDCIGKLKQLREMGVSVALDDFGTGYSSLSYINELPLDAIKIDRSFVINLHKNNTLELAKAIISLSHHMRVKVVAEGTETLEQVEILRSIKCDLFQGYYFAKPMDSVEFCEWLSQPNDRHIRSDEH